MKLVADSKQLAGTISTYQKLTIMLQIALQIDTIKTAINDGEILWFHCTLTHHHGVYIYILSMCTCQNYSTLMNIEYLVSCLATMAYALQHAQYLLPFLSWVRKDVRASRILRVVRPITLPCITGCYGACNSESIAAMNMQFFALQCIALPFPEEAWQGYKILTYLLINVSNEVTYLHETAPFWTILTKGIQ